VRERGLEGEGCRPKGRSQGGRWDGETSTVQAEEGERARCNAGGGGERARCPSEGGDRGRVHTHGKHPAIQKQVCWGSSSQAGSGGRGTEWGRLRARGAQGQGYWRALQCEKAARMDGDPKWWGGAGAIQPASGIRGVGCSKREGAKGCSNWADGRCYGL
jgi:hypothetical protein